MPTHGVMQWLRRLATVSGESRPDHELIGRFAQDGDEAAFTSLVQRHGPMIYGVCLRLLDQGQDAEDAFQATFLVLARKARSIRKQESVSCWLYGVASRIARNVRRKGAKQRHETIHDVGSPPADVTWREVRTVLDEELARLPERLRLPLVLCYLDGKTRDEAAQELGWSEPTLRGRLERGRDLLRSRLTGRGVTLSSALLATMLTENAASALPASLARSTVAAAGVIAAGKPLAGVVSAQIVGLVLMEVNAMFIGKLIHAAIIILAATVLLGGVAAGTGALLREEPGNDAVVAEQKKDEKPAAKAPAQEMDYFIRGVLREQDKIKKKWPNGGFSFPLVFENAEGKELPKETKFLFVDDPAIKIDRLTPSGLKRLDVDVTGISPGATIAIERKDVGEIEKKQNVWWIKPRRVVVLKDDEFDNTLTFKLAGWPPETAPDDDELRKLLVKKLNAQVAGISSFDEQLRAGKINLGDQQNTDQIVSAVERCIETQLELASTHERRVAVRKRGVEAFRVLHKEAEPQWRSGRLGTDKYSLIEQAFIEAEIQLLKEKRRAK